MPTARAGVVGQVDINGPIATGQPMKLLDPSAGSFWAVAFFLAAVIVLFFVL